MFVLQHYFINYVQKYFHHCSLNIKFSALNDVFINATSKRDGM